MRWKSVAMLLAFRMNMPPEAAGGIGEGRRAGVGVQARAGLHVVLDAHALDVDGVEDDVGAAEELGHARDEVLAGAAAEAGVAVDEVALASHDHVVFLRAGLSGLARIAAADE